MPYPFVGDVDPASRSEWFASATAEIGWVGSLCLGTGGVETQIELEHASPASQPSIARGTDAPGAASINGAVASSCVSPRTLYLAVKLPGGDNVRLNFLRTELWLYNALLKTSSW